MQRSAWSGAGRGSDKRLPEHSAAGYSKTRKHRQGPLQLAKRALTGPWRWLTAAALLVLVYGAWHLVGGRGGYQRRLAVLVAQTEAEHTATLMRLHPVHADWVRLQGELVDRGDLVREASADVERLEEMHTQRLESLDDLSHHNVSLANQMKDAWQAEVVSSHDRLSQAKEQLEDSKWREEEIHAVVTQLHDEAVALSSAVMSLGLRVVGGSSQEGPLDAAVSRMLGRGAIFDKDVLINAYRPHGESSAWHMEKGALKTSSARLLGELPEGLQTPALRTGGRPPPRGAVVHADPRGPPVVMELVKPQLGDSQVLIQRHEAHESLKGARAGMAGSGVPPNATLRQSTDGDIVFQTADRSPPIDALSMKVRDPMQQQSPSPTPATKKSAEQLQEELSHKLAAMTGGEGFRSTRGGRAGRAAGSKGAKADAQQEDDSVRCRMSQICEGVLECGSGDELGCVTDTKERQAKVRAAAQWAWQGYRDHAWGKDELLALSKASSQWFNLGLTLVDALDTLLLLKLDAEFEEARKWVAVSMEVAQNSAVNLFETTIRVLGGLLAAFHLSGGDDVFLFRAAELGVRLTPAFNSPTGIPFSDVNLKTLHATQPRWTPSSSTSEATSVDLEFTFLAHAAGEKEGAQKSVAAVEKLVANPSLVEGLAPIYVSPHTGGFAGSQITLGARGDSFYEYLLKQWLLTGKQNDVLLQGYKQAMKGVRDLLLQNTSPEGGLLYVAELHSKSLFHKMDHLVCFLPGTLALGHWHGVSTGDVHEPSDLDIAQQLMATCYEMYRRTPAGLSPEIVFFDAHEDLGSQGNADYPKQHAGDVGGGDFHVKPQDAHNLLRPETVESLFVMWRVTGDVLYRTMGWHIFRAFEKWTRLDSGGYTNLHDVLKVPPPRRDKMESFWLAETLKYLYLLFDDSTPAVLPLDQYVFNTEAHALPILGSPADQALASHYRTGPFGTPLPSNSSAEERAQAWRKASADLAAEQYPGATSSTARLLLQRWLSKSSFSAS